MVAGLVPWWLTQWRTEPVWLPVRIAGGLLTAAAAAVLISAFVRFVMEGVGTPAPVAPPQHLVVGGWYRYVRNPMYVAVIGAIVGQALFLGRLSLLLYAGGAFLVMAGFVYLYEEPDLRERFGAEYDEYRKNVPAWWPRLRPWKP